MFLLCYSYFENIFIRDFSSAADSIHWAILPVKERDLNFWVTFGLMTPTTTLKFTSTYTSQNATCCLTFLTDELKPFYYNSANI